MKHILPDTAAASMGSVEKEMVNFVHWSYELGKNLMWAKVERYSYNHDLLFGIANSRRRRFDALDRERLWKMLEARMDVP